MGGSSHSLSIVVAVSSSIAAPGTTLDSSSDTDKTTPNNFIYLSGEGLHQYHTIINWSVRLSMSREWYIPWLHSFYTPLPPPYLYQTSNYMYLYLYTQPISLLPYIYLVQYAPYLICSSHPDPLHYDLLCSTLIYSLHSTIISLIRFSLFDLIPLLQSDLFDMNQSTLICSLWYDLIKSNPIQSHPLFSSLIFFTMFTPIQPNFIALQDISWEEHQERRNNRNSLEGISGYSIETCLYICDFSMLGNDQLPAYPTPDQLLL